MELLALSIAFLGTIYFAIHHPGFRRGLLFVASGMAVLVTAFAIYVWNVDRQTEARRQIASKVIRQDQIEILDAKLALGSLPELSGTVVNQSGHELAGLTIKVVVSDCPQAQHIARDLPPGFELEKPQGNTTKSDQRGKFDDLIPAKNQNQKAAPNSKPDNPWEDSRNSASRATTAETMPENRCGIVGEGVEHLSINVPKGQKRAFATHVVLPKLPDLKEWSWSFSVEERIAKY